ncbi:MAG TPA: hypothetical protein VLL49_10200 [Anaerolineales bacterium]|nr:hypothetical protein [Anaerolineales bacterium]
MSKLLMNQRIQDEAEGATLSRVRPDGAVQPQAINLADTVQNTVPEACHDLLMGGPASAHRAMCQLVGIQRRQPGCREVLKDGRRSRSRWPA